ncbi:hypothetical protein CBP34_12350 [Acidovorax carolinensis]|uniref:Uncharacterized protein n=1 Tax=Acidovorax carolinensis TaxID=553814 RepID=A0A240U375_9BURK|nr:hypothetical protein CBP34_12350 [Acidovorax carolinensis]
MNLIELSLLLITKFSQCLILRLQLIILTICNVIFQLSDSTLVSSQIVKNLACRTSRQCF